MSAGAICIGGYMVTRYKLTIQQDAKFIFICVFTSVLMLVPLFFMKCAQYPAQDVPLNMRSVNYTNLSAIIIYSLDKYTLNDSKLKQIVCKYYCIL